jgi:polar amino acid transport system substrate-binding protein
MRRRSTGVLAILTVVILAGTACAKSTPTTGESPTAGSPSPSPLSVLTAGTLTVGSCLDYSPFEYFTQGSTTPIGFDVDIMDAIAKKLGLTVTWKKANFDTIFTALAAGQFDAVAAASTIKPDRLQVVDFSDPYFNSRQSLTVNTSKSPGIKTTDDLKSGDVVGVQKGTTGKDWAEANLAPKGIQIKTYTNAPDAFTDLEAGQITGVINDEGSSLKEAQGRPGLAVVQPIDTGEHYGIAVGKNHKDILAGINGALKAIIADGEYKTIFKKYFPNNPVPPEYGG